MISDCYPEIKTRDSLILINIGDCGGQEQILSAEKMHYFASFVVCIVLVVIVQGTNPNESGQPQGTVESVRGLLENVLKRLERLEKKVKEHSTILGDCCDKTKVPDPVAFFPLNAASGTKEIKNRAAQGVPSGVSLAPGPDGKVNGSYEFSGTANSYIEFQNSEGGPLDVRYSMTMLCWVYHNGKDGPLFNYKTSGHWGVHLWVVGGQLFVRFARRDYSFTSALLSTPLAGGWKFVGASYDGGSGDAKLWVNGAAVQTFNIGAGLDLATQDNIRMGVKTGDGRYFKGRITQMHVYKDALSQEQVQAIYKRMQVLDPVAFFPLNAAHGTREIKNRVAQGVPRGVRLAPGPDGKADSAYEFAGTADSFIAFPNSQGRPLDVRYSMTMLCWVYYNGQDGPLFNYKTRGQWGVHLWVVGGQLFVRFTRRDYSFTTSLLHTPLAGGWKFVGASYDGYSGDAKLWVNGAVVQTLNIGAGLDLATQDNIRMGVKTGDGRYFKGRIAQMHVYKDALRQEQIQEIYKRMQA